MMLHDEVGSVIRTRRRDLGLTQEQLADLAGVSHRFVWSVENGKANVRLDLVLDLLDTLGLELRLQRRSPR